MIIFETLTPIPGDHCHQCFQTQCFVLLSGLQMQKSEEGTAKVQGGRRDFTILERQQAQPREAVNFAMGRLAGKYAMLSSD